MTHFVLIHGYGYGSTVSHPFFSRYVFLGFQAFNPLIKTGRAVLFDWSVQRHLRPQEIINPFFQYQMYREDRKRAVSPQIQASLSDLLMREKPKVIIAHSMGVRLLMQQVSQIRLPSSVRHIVSVQADLPHTYTPKNTYLYQDLMRRSIIWHNYYCPWDNALVGSVFINQYLPKGLVGSKDPLIRNVFFPLRSGPNYHTSSISDETFRTAVEALCDEVS